MSAKSLLLSVYGAAPIWTQNLAFSAYGLHTRRLRYSPAFHKTLEGLNASQWWDAEQISAYRNERIVETVRDAYANVPFYRKLYDEHGVNVGAIKEASDLELLPVVTKSMVREHAVSMRSTRFGEKGLYLGRTSGTTGTALVIPKTKETVARQWAVWWRHKGRFGLRCTDRHVMFGVGAPIDARRSSSVLWRWDYANKRAYLSSFHLSPSNIHQIADYLSANNFSFYAGFPSAIAEFVRLLNDEGLKIESGPRVVVTGSDALLPSYRKLITTSLGTTVTEQYGMAEFAGNIAECEHGQLHVDHECCHVETRKLPGTAARSLILTGFWIPAMPFIRYEVGDTVAPGTPNCPCGRASQTFCQIDGRLEDYIVTPDGRRIQGMNRVLKHARHAKAIQIYQSDKHNVEFRVVATDDFSAEDETTLIESFVRRAGGDMNIRFKRVDRISPDSSGKVRGVVSKVTL